MAITLYIPKDSPKLPDNDQWTNRFRIKSESSNRMYTIAQHKSNRYWGCDCPGWKIHKACKHLRSMNLLTGMRPQEVNLPSGR